MGVPRKQDMAIVSISTDGKRRPFVKRWSSFPKARRIYAFILSSLALTAILGAAYTTVTDFTSSEAHGPDRRSGGGVELVPGLNGECGTENENGGKAFGFSLLYVLINVYIFLGIAIICDNQFTSSLQMICSEFGLNLNNDVAGATFMAAGSSAPELATSFVGTFLSDSNVGVGTIIGSAVFNILVIIGATALLSSRPLQLDFRPVIRDNFFYFVSVIILICIIKVGGNDDIDTTDAVILLIWYACYIIYMKFNEDIIDKFCPHLDEDHVHPHTSPSVAHPDLKMGELQDSRSETPSSVHLEGKGTKSDAGKLPSGTGNGAKTETEMQAVSATEDEPVPSARKKKKSIPQHHYLSHQQPLKDLEAACAEDDNQDSEDEDEDDGPLDQIYNVLAWPWEMLFKFTMPDCYYPFDLIDHLEEKVGDRVDTELAPEDRKENWYALGDFMDEPYPDDVIGEDKLPDNEEMTYLDVRKQRFRDLDANDPLKVQMLQRQDKKIDGRLSQLKDIKKEHNKDLTCGQRWFWAAFLMSLLHITWMSYFMVEFMVKIGCLWNISETVMGLTFLAMGTSIPDALGSLAVAEQGEGDMAVSNAVGSNVFDICMGLGLPWFIKCVAGDGPIPIEDTDTIIPSILILVAIIVLLFTTFAFSKWQLVNQVGYILLSAYVCFVIYSLVFDAVK